MNENKTKDQNRIHLSLAYKKQWIRTIEITPFVLSDHHEWKLDVNNRSNRELERWITPYWKKNGQQRKTSKNFRIQWNWIHNIPEFMGHDESGTKEEVHSTRCLHENICEISYQQLNRTPGSSRTKKVSNPRRSRMGRINIVKVSSYQNNVEIQLQSRSKSQLNSLYTFKDNYQLHMEKWKKKPG